MSRKQHSDSLKLQRSKNQRHVQDKNSLATSNTRVSLFQFLKRIPLIANLCECDQSVPFSIYITFSPKPQSHVLQLNFATSKIFMIKMNKRFVMNSLGWLKGGRETPAQAVADSTGSDSIIFPNYLPNPKSMPRQLNQCLISILLRLFSKN